MAASEAGQETNPNQVSAGEVVDSAGSRGRDCSRRGSKLVPVISFALCSIRKASSDGKRPGAFVGFVAPGVFFPRRDKGFGIAVAFRGFNECNIDDFSHRDPQRA